MNGYAHPDYARALAEFGTPRELRRSGGWVLERPIPGTPLRDAMGCYPLFCCRDWSALKMDIDAIDDGGLVSLVLVTDPFADVGSGDLQWVFQLVREFKAHFISNLDKPVPEIVSKNHRRNSRKALRQMDIHYCEDPLAHLSEWIRLYRETIAKHATRDIRAFSSKSFTMQLALPGVRMFRAVAGGETLGFQIWMAEDGVAYDHLSAFAPAAYKLLAAYGLRWHALHYFREETNIRLVDNGAGRTADGADGLGQFKKGWADTTRPVWLCGKVLNPKRFAQLNDSIQPTNYFPPYRAGEFKE